MAGTTVLKEREQHERRVPMEKVDHAGRIWHCEVDLHDRLRGHCAMPTLDGAYKPPIDIPYKYMKKVDPKRPFRMLIDFNQWKADWRGRMTERMQRLQELAQVMYPNDFGDKLEQPTPELLRMLGPLPIPFEFIEACEVGNPWALGIPKEDGSYRKRPSWATDELWGQYQTLRQSYWTAMPNDDGTFAPADPAKYPDEEDEEEPTAIAEGVYADEEQDAPVARGRRTRTSA